MDKCIFHKQENVIHYFDGKPQPDCITCDGYGKDSAKHGWNCYLPKREFRRVKKYDSREPARTNV